MPLRVPITIESSPRSLQWLFAPRLNIDFENFAGRDGWNFGAGVGPVFAARQVSRILLFGARAFRDGRAVPSIAPTAVTRACTCWLSLSKRFPKYWVGAFLRYDWLGGAEFDDSPLVRRQNYLAGGFGIAWMIGESKRRVRRRTSQPNDATPSAFLATASAARPAARCRRALRPLRRVRVSSIARSPSDRMPTSRLSRVSTGRRRIRSSPMFCVTSSIGLVFVAVLDLTAHDVADRGVRAAAGCHRAHRDVAVGDHADQAVVLLDRQRADVELAPSISPPRGSV